jgi:hypothetical protein
MCAVLGILERTMFPFFAFALQSLGAPLPLNLLCNFPRARIKVFAFWVDPQRIHRVFQGMRAVPLDQALPVRGVLID